MIKNYTSAKVALSKFLEAGPNIPDPKEGVDVTHRPSVGVVSLTLTGVI